MPICTSVFYRFTCKSLADLKSEVSVSLQQCCHTHTSSKRQQHADVVNAAPPIQSVRMIPLTRDAETKPHASSKASRGACVTLPNSRKCLLDVILRASASSYPSSTAGLSDALKCWPPLWLFTEMTASVVSFLLAVH